MSMTKQTVIYHGSGGGGAVDQAGGAEPRPGGQDAVQVEEGERPQEEELEPDEADEEEGLLGDEVVADPGGVPGAEVDEGAREEGLGEARLGVEQGRAHGHDEEEEEQDGVDQLHQSTHFPLAGGGGISFVRSRGRGGGVVEGGRRLAAPCLRRSGGIRGRGS